MKQRRLDEVLAECLTACLEGRRTVEESLSLYPSLSDHLEPLLRTATSVANSFQAYDPPSYMRERGLQRFLASARTRVRARALTRGMALRPSAASWGPRQWAFLSSGIAAAVALVLVTGVVMSNGSGGGESVVFNQPAPMAGSTSLVASPVRNYTVHVDTISAKLSQGQTIEPDEITKLTQITSEIGDPSALDQASQKELAKTVPNAIAALETIDSSQSSRPEVLAALSAANGLKAKLPPEFSPPASVTTGPSEPPTQTPAATPTPAPTETPAPPTAAPTPNDQSGATPAPTTDVRGVDTFSQPLNINPLATPAKEP